jgi:hypothetical protein
LRSGTNREMGGSGGPPIATRLRGHEIPIGLAAAFTVSFLLGIVKLFTRPYATAGGIAMCIL